MLVKDGLLGAVPKESAGTPHHYSNRPRIMHFPCCSIALGLTASFGIQKEVWKLR